MDLATTAPAAASTRRRSSSSPLTACATILAPIAVGLAPPIWLWASNRTDFPPTVILRPAILVVVAAVLLLALFRWLTGDLGAASLLVSATFVAVFMFGNQLDILAAILGREPRRGPLLIRVANIIVLGLTIAGVTVLARRGRDLGRVARFVGLIAVILIVLAVVRPFGAVTDVSLGLDGAGPGLGEGAASGATTPSLAPMHPRSVPVLAHDDAAHPDVYYVILDGYARADALAAHYGFDNAPFIEALKARGFYIGDKSSTNYSVTYLSLASSLNGRYLTDEVGQLGRQGYYDLIQSAKVPAAFRDRGYRYNMTRTVWDGTTGSPIADAELGAAPTFANEYEAALAEQSILRGVLPKTSIADYHRAAFAALRAVAEDPSPTFTFSHLILPHPPYVFDHDGSVILDTTSLRGAWGGTANKQAYIEQVRFANQQMLDTVDAIRSASTTPPVIILQSDHGSWTGRFDGNPPLADVMRERMSILNAYLVPDSVRELLYPTITPVNSFRAIDKGLFGESIALLPDRSWYGVDDSTLEPYVPAN